ncbi:MAG TPA: DNA primase [Longimicrobiaceae bacterium]|nr:DNA primase [Longimicrobiaceae bacterium]
MSIPDSVIEEVRHRGDLVEIVSEHTRLKRSGRTFRGPCPLHGGSGPNFSVDPSKNVFKCFTCGEAGDIFSFPMKHLGMDFLDAVRFVAARAGVEIPERQERRPEDDPNRRLYETNDFAAEWFRRRLWDDAEGKKAREYLEGRGIGREAAERFGLGWAPEEWTAFGDAARKQGIGNDLLLSLGLVKESQKGNREPYDAFRGRIIFPIEDLGGRVVAFGGRILGKAEEHVPKYLNSPETPIYHKGDLLYGLGWSRGAIRKAEAALVVEGYMDYVSLAAHGVENAVAPLGTAMTEAQAELIGRYAPRAILLYDSDKAGLKATFRSGDELLRAAVEVLVATLPEGEDPDSLVRAKGQAALRKYLDDAVDVLERKIQILERKGLFDSISGTRRSIDALMPTIRAASDEVLRGVYLRRLSEKTGVPQETLQKEVAEAPARDTRPRGYPERRERNEGRRAEDFGAPPALVVAPSLGPERNLLLLMLRDETWVERTVRVVGPEEFRYPIYRNIFEKLIELEGSRDGEGEWLEGFPPEVLPVLEELRGDPELQEMGDAEEFFQANVRDLLARPFEERLTEIEREMAVANPDQQTRLTVEKEQITGMMRKRGLLRKAGFVRQAQNGARPQR